jgi:hypothetical protein
MMLTCRNKARVNPIAWDDGSMVGVWECPLMKRGMVT